MFSRNAMLNTSKLRTDNKTVENNEKQFSLLVSPTCLCQESYTPHVYGYILCFLGRQIKSHLQKQAGMFLLMHGSTRSAQTLGGFLCFSQGARIDLRFLTI